MCDAKCEQTEQQMEKSSMMQKEKSSTRILFIFRTMDTGGAQKIQAFVANACFQAGFAVSAITLTKKPTTVDINPEIQTTVVDYDHVGKATHNPVLKIARKLLFLCNLRKRIKHMNPDLVCVFLTDTVRVVSIATRGLKIPILASERGDPFQFSHKKIRQYSRALNKCEEVVFQLEKAKEPFKLKESLRTSIIPNPCIPRLGMQFANEGTIRKADKYILSAGRLCKQKRFDVLINAFSLFQLSHPEYQLIIYGEGEERSALELLIERKGLRGRVLLPGDTLNPFDNKNHPTVFALSSDFEGIPNVLIEAMGYGIPCISTDCSPGGASFLLDEGNRGVIVPVADWRALSEGLVMLVENPKMREEYAAKGKEIFELFPPNKIEGMWLKAIERCLE